MFRIPLILLRVLFLATLLLGVSPWAAEASRVALLVGNAEYGRPEMRLRNPGRDVAALGIALERLGFDVIRALDQNTEEMSDALRRFETKAKDAEMAVFFYAGHGVQIGGENHLIGTDFRGSDLAALRQSSVTLGTVRALMVRAAPKIGMMILDACRDNPFSESGLVAQGLSRSDGGAGLLIAYATDPGNVAYDGAGQNSAFAASLVKHIATPGLDVRLMFGRVRQDVVLATGGRQVPWVEESVLGEHAFAAGAPAVSADGQASEFAFWRRIADSTLPEDFEAYLADYPEGLFARFARQRIKALGGAPSDAPGRADTLLASADPARLRAALATMGLLSETDTRPETLTRALQIYQAQLPDPAALSEAQLVNDATRSAMYLAATTLQHLRTDMVALRSVERTLLIAEDALGQIEEIAKTDPAAVPILDEARADVSDIRRSRATILLRLDESRSYYSDVLTRSVKFVPDDTTSDLLVTPGQARGVNPAERTLTKNASLFLQHVVQADDSRKGSYQWLTDLLPSD